MMNMLKNHRGQGVTIQYALTFALVLAIITAMSVYFKRTVQGRFAGARDYANRMINAEFQKGTYNLVGSFALQYEPYYTERAVEMERSGAIIDYEIGGVGMAPIQGREYEQFQTTLRATSNQLAPKDAH